MSLKINGLSSDVGISRAHFEEINLLGMDYLKNQQYFVDGRKKVITIDYDDDW